MLIFRIFLLKLFILQTIICYVICTNSKPPTPKLNIDALTLTDRNFQILFINEVRNTVDHMSAERLNRFLEQLKPNIRDPMHLEALNRAMEAHSISPKILFIKQYLDVENLQDDSRAELESFVLRNVNFLSKLKKELRQMQETSIMEQRQFRMYQLCKQFREKSGNRNRYSTTTTARPLYAAKLVPFDESNIDVALKKLNATRNIISINLNDFGRTLYGRVNAAGAEIIDDYLTSLRKLLQEVIVEKSAHEQDTSKLSKLLDEIDNVVGTPDFYEKRQKLYSYLENNLAADYERFQSSEHAQENLAEILGKLRERGLDLFVTFLFSNFEFLERLHQELEKLLPPAWELGEYDQVTNELYAVHTSYIDFKRDSESNDKYEAYVERAKALHTRTSNIGNDGHIYELLYNASLNVGSVTLNMIRAKCEDV